VGKKQSPFFIKKPPFFEKKDEKTFPEGVALEKKL
jgi:hypothetical protein